MSEEIEEILDELESLFEISEAPEHIINGFNKLKDYITNLQQKVEQLEKEVNEYQKELEKADSITQSCIFQGKQESEISFRNCLNKLEQLENIRKEAIESTKDVKQFVYDEFVDRNVSGATETYCKIRDLLNILNKGSDKE